VLHVAEQVVEDLTLLHEQQELEGLAFLFREQSRDNLGEVSA